MTMKSRTFLALDTVLPGRSGSCSNLELRRCCAVAMRCTLTFLGAASFARPAQAASPVAEASACPHVHVLMPPP